MRPSLKLNDFEQRSTNGLHDGTHYLIAQAVRIYDRARLPSLDNATKSHLFGRRIQLDFDAASNISALLGSARNAKLKYASSAARASSLCPMRAAQQPRRPCLAPTA
jgi:hypothetical protein